MPDYRRMSLDGLNSIKAKQLNESIIYPEGIKERMHSKLEEDLINNRTSLGDSPCFPIGDERNFATIVVGERFKDVVNEVKKAYNVVDIDETGLMMEMLPLVKGVLSLEKPHKKKLEELAVKMVREEFDIPEDVIIEAELTTNIDGFGTSDKPLTDLVVEFEDHDEMSYANDSIYKRRFANAMNQGAAKKVNHMYHMVDSELADMDPTLLNQYKKVMSSADYMYYMYPDLNKSANGGKCDVEFGSKEENRPPKIIAKAMIFPVLIHELVKACMEILSAHGLPTKKHIAEYVIDKSDYLQAEPWDMRIGPGLWGRFCMVIPAEDFNLKHHLYADISKLEPSEYASVMKEIMAGTKKGKAIISEMLEDIKEEIRIDEYNESMGDNLFELEDLL